MSWTALANNQLISRSDLQDAVTTGVFQLRAGQTIDLTAPNNNRFVTKSEVETWLFASVSTATSNQYPEKDWLTPITTTSTTTTTSTIAPTTTTTTTLATTTSTTTTLAPTTTTTTLPPTTTTTTTLAGPYFTVNMHNESANVNVQTQIVHNSDYTSNIPSLNVGQDGSDTHWPVSLWTTGGTIGVYVQSFDATSRNYKLDVYLNSSFINSGPTNAISTASSGGTGINHYITGGVPAITTGDTIDIYLVLVP